MCFTAEAAAPTTSPQQQQAEGGGGSSSSSSATAQGLNDHQSPPSGSGSSQAKPGGGARLPTRPEVQLLCLDMDGTLLDSRSRVRPSSARALREVLERGVQVCLATGKARPAAIKAMETVGLAGEGELEEGGG